VRYAGLQQWIPRLLSSGMCIWNISSECDITCQETITLVILYFSFYVLKYSYELLWPSKTSVLEQRALHITLFGQRNILLYLLDFTEVCLLPGHLNATNQIHRIWKFNILYWKKNLVMYVTVLRFCVSEQASMTAETGRYSSVQVTANKYSPFKTSMFDKYYTRPSIFRSGYDSWNDFRLKDCRMLRYFLCAARNLWLNICSAFGDTHVNTNLY
jgi:hypothetical protein